MFKFLFKSAFFTYLAKRYRQEITTTLKAIFSLLVITYFYTDIVELLITLDRQDLLVYLLAVKWLSVSVILYIVVKNIRQLFKATMTQAKNQDKEPKITTQIDTATNRPTQTQEVIARHTKLQDTRHTDDYPNTRPAHHKDDILKAKKLDSMGDIILKKHKPNDDD